MKINSNGIFELVKLQRTPSTKCPVEYSFSKGFLTQGKTGHLLVDPLISCCQSFRQVLQCGYEASLGMGRIAKFFYLERYPKESSLSALERKGGLYRRDLQPMRLRD